jgi:hypothetical protein
VGRKVRNRRHETGTGRAGAESACSKEGIAKRVRPILAIAPTGPIAAWPVFRAASNGGATAAVAKRHSRPEAGRLPADSVRRPLAAESAAGAVPRIGAGVGRLAPRSVPSTPDNDH